MGELTYVQSRVWCRLVYVRYVSEASCCIRVPDAAATTRTRGNGFRDAGDFFRRCAAMMDPCPAWRFVLWSMLVCVDTLASLSALTIRASPMAQS